MDLFSIKGQTLEYSLTNNFLLNNSFVAICVTHTIRLLRAENQQSNKDKISRTKGLELFLTIFMGLCPFTFNSKLS